MEQSLSFAVDGRTVDLFVAEVPESPIIYLNTFPGQGRVMVDTCQELGCPDFSLAAISGLNWDHDMSPWAIPPISPEDTPCTGGAPAFLELLTEEMIPRCEEQLPGTPCWRGLAGYSLAGLFAIWALYRTDRFDRVASVSGSLWFPDFLPFVRTQSMRRRPDCVYLSLGDREHRTDNPFLKSVMERTEELAAFYAGQRIPTVFEKNPGNHFAEPAQRTCRGIRWLLTR